MKRIWELYENLNEFVYVSDIDTNEIVYINKYGRDRLDIERPEDVAGQMCYKVLQKCSEPCPMCTNRLLKQGEFHEWTYYNELLGRRYSLKDTLIEHEGRRYRLELAVDITVLDEQEQAIKEYTTNESLVNDALRLALAEATPEKSLDTLLEYVGRSLKSERIYIFEENACHTFDNTYEWCAEGVEPQKDNLQAVPFEAVDLWYEAFHKNENIVITDVEDIRESDPEAYAYLEPQKIHSLVVSPIVFRDQIVGFYGVDNPPKGMLNHISIMFLVLGHFIASILRRRDLVKRLETMSYYDQLTGALNRHGMNEFIERVDHDASIGILYCDVMGLKKVNDSRGHLAGDDLLIRSYQCISEVFHKNSIFRIGGDEFLILSSTISREEMEQKIDVLRSKMVKHDVHLALGFIWEPQCSGRIRELLKLADERMYDEKERYYAGHPEERFTRK